MNFKKFISGISALTIAASAFAGMAVTASALTNEVYNKTFSSMTAEDGAAEANNWSIVNPNSDGGTKSISFVEESGIKYSHSTRTKSSYAKTSIGSANGVADITGTWNTGSSNSTYGNDVYVSFNDADGNTAFAILSQYNDKKLYLQIGNSTTYTTMQSNVRDTVNTADDVTFTAEYDTDNTTLNSLTVTTPAGTYNLPAAAASDAGVITEVRIGALMDGDDPKNRFDMNSTLKALTITSTVPDPGAVTSVKVKYQLANGTEIQTDTLAITDCYTRADSKVAVTSAVEGDEVYIPFKAYILKDGTLYQTTANNSDPYYGNAVTLTSDTVLTKTVTEYSTTGTVVLFEDLEQTPGENAAIRASNMSAYNNTGYTSANDLPAGVYTFIIRALNKGRGSSVKVGDTTVAGIGDITKKNAWGIKTVSDVTISTAGKLSLQKGAISIDCYDIIIAIKTADLPTDGAEVTAVSYNNYQGGTFAGDDPVTAAKVLVTVTGSITKLGLKYNYSGDNWTDAQYANTLTAITNGTILLGAILPGTLAPTTESFKAVID